MLQRFSGPSHYKYVLLLLLLLRPWLAMVDTNFKSIFMCLWMSFNTLFSVLKNVKTKYLFHFAISPFRYFAISLIIISPI